MLHILSSKESPRRNEIKALATRLIASLENLQIKSTRRDSEALWAAVGWPAGLFLGVAHRKLWKALSQLFRVTSRAFFHHGLGNPVRRFRKILLGLLVKSFKIAS